MRRSDGRDDGRSAEQLRPLSLTKNVFTHADGSVLLSIGKTQVLCAVSLVEGVPVFLRGKGEGWLTAEYALLPASTAVRTPRDQLLGKRNGRSVEISRLIGRALRCVVNLKQLGEFTITIDCDVLNADGGTRCAAICGAQAALNLAVSRWLEADIIKQSILTAQLGAISVGVQDTIILLDLTAQEDNTIDSDFNFVLTSDNHIIEVQGTAEQKVISWSKFEAMRKLATHGIEQLCAFIEQETNPLIGS
jgi:ribonuclease PH